MGIAIIGSAGMQAGLGAGAAARGEFHCTDCGYGIVVHRVLPTCPMCRGTDWQPSPSRRLFPPLDIADQHA
jgi:Zn finger protein HypA/HybF involved in hydrogenase expression